MLWKFSVMIIYTFCSEHNSLRHSRRIISGNRTYSEKGYMVYLLKSNKSTQEYDSWLCGGAIVSPIHILTSAACVKDVSYLYAVAGYNKYVRVENLSQDNCTKDRVQKIVKQCYPQKYDLNYSNASQWLYLDIGIAFVEKPYNFSDYTYKFYCSYIPRPIKINYNPKYMTPTTAGVITFGWGHTIGVRPPGDYQDYNQIYMREAPTTIIPKTRCYERYKNMKLDQVISDFMICCEGKGPLDSAGNPEDIEPAYVDGGVRRYDRSGMSPENFVRFNWTVISDNDTNSYHNEKELRGRRQGICQNDHGGPLVAWIGTEEYVLGVASTSLISKELLCEPPYLFTSTQCASRFIKCVMEVESARKMCDNLGEEGGFELNKQDIDWTRNDKNKENSTIAPENISKRPKRNDSEDIFKLNQFDSNYEQNDNDFDKETNEDTMFQMNEENYDNKEEILPNLADDFNFDAVTDDVVMIY